MNATLSPDATQFTLAGPTWSETLPITLLPDRIRFYRRLAARKGGKYAHVHAETVVALERVARDLKQGDPADG